MIETVCCATGRWCTADWTAHPCAEHRLLLRSIATRVRCADVIVEGDFDREFPKAPTRRGPSWMASSMRKWEEAASLGSAQYSASEAWAMRGVCARVKRDARRARRSRFMTTADLGGEA